MNKFKIGDVVEILNNNHRYSEDFTGQITEIIEVVGDRAEGSCCDLRVSYKNGSYAHLTFNAENLKLIRSADVEESRLFEVGDIVHIAPNSRYDTDPLFVEYGIISDNTNPDCLDVKVILNKGEEENEFCYFPNQLGLVDPLVKAPDLWKNVENHLNDYEKINLVHEIFNNKTFDDTCLNRAFAWSSSKKGYNYWQDIHKRIMKKIELLDSPEEIESENVSAADILQQAKDCLVNRASERDKEQERSMKSCVEAFNALTGKSLTETEGWIFMTVLKIARSQGGNFKLDDYVDMAAYAALAGESGGK